MRSIPAGVGGRLALATLSLVTSAVLLASATDALAAGSPPLVVAASSTPMTLTQATPLADGQYSTSWTAPGGVTAYVTAAPGSVITLREPDTHTAVLSVGPPPTLVAAAAIRRGKAHAAANTFTNGQIYASAGPTEVCKYVALCTTGAMTQTMFEHVPGAWYIGNKVTSSGYSNNGVTIKLSEAWSSFPGETGDSRVQWSPSGSVTTTTNVTNITVSAGWNGFGISASFPVNRYSTVGPIFPSGDTFPAFGSKWTGSSNSNSCCTVYQAADSADTIHLGPGQTPYGTLNVATNG
jgi:hypothetical protein